MLSPPSSYQWQISSGSRGESRKSLKRLLRNEASRRSKKSRLSKNGGIKKVGEHKKRKLQEPELFRDRQEGVESQVAEEAKLAGEVEVVEDEVIQLEVEVGERVKEGLQMLGSDIAHLCI